MLLHCHLKLLLNPRIAGSHLVQLKIERLIRFLLLGGLEDCNVLDPNDHFFSKSFMHPIKSIPALGANVHYERHFNRASSLFESLRACKTYILLAT